MDSHPYSLSLPLSSLLLLLLLLCSPSCSSLWSGTAAAATEGLLASPGFRDMRQVVPHSLQAVCACVCACLHFLFVPVLLLIGCDFPNTPSGFANQVLGGNTTVCGSFVAFLGTNRVAGKQITTSNWPQPAIQLPLNCGLEYRQFG